MPNGKLCLNNVQTCHPTVTNRKLCPNNNPSNSAMLRSFMSNTALYQDKETKPFLDADEDANDHGLSVTDVPAIFHEPYIGTAYRRVGLSEWKCCQSILRLNNETFNVWTHIVGLALFVLHYPTVVFQDHSPLQEVFVYPLLCLAVGISSTFMMSVVAHTFNCMSVRARKICFFVDYAGISFYTFTAGMAFYFYSRPVNTEWRIFNEPSLFLSASACVSFASTFIICRALYHQSPHRSKIIALTYSTSWVFNTLSYTSCIFLYPSQLNAASLHYFKRHCVFYVLGTGIYVVNFPERLMAGVFDVFGHSHQFMHILCAMGAADEFVTVQLDMLNRQELLKEFPGPNAYNCLVMLVVVMFGNFALVFWFAKKLFTQKTETDSE